MVSEAALGVGLGTLDICKIKFWLVLSSCLLLREQSLFPPCVDYISKMVIEGLGIQRAEGG